MHALAKMRCHKMAKATGTQLTPEHLTVLEYAWDYYRKRRVGPLYTNMTRNTGVDRDTIEVGVMLCDTLAKFGHTQRIGVTQQFFLQSRLRRRDNLLRRRCARLSDFQMQDILTRRGEFVGGAHNIHDNEGVDQTPLGNFQRHLVVPKANARKKSFFIGADGEAVATRFRNELTDRFARQSLWTSETVDPA